MADKLKAKRLTFKENADNLEKAGDYYISNSLGYSDEKKKSHQAIILKCPYCGREMASTAIHIIYFKKTWWTKLFTLDSVPTISPMLQCPYVNSHMFKVKNGKVLAV